MDYAAKSYPCGSKQESLMHLPKVRTVASIEIKHVRDNAIGLVFRLKKQDEAEAEPVYGIMRQQVHELHEALSRVIESGFEESG